MAGDAYFDKVALLLHGDGANGSTTFTDSSAVPKTVAALGGAVVSTAQSKWGGASISGENTAGARVQINSHADFNMGAGDFTVECWAYVVARNASNFEFFVARRITTGYWGFWLQIDQATGCPEFSMCNTSLSIFKATSTTTFPLGQWVHLAGVRNGSQITLFVNGVQAASTAVSGTNYGSTEPVILFGTSDGDARFKLNGYVDDLRITKGEARYTTNFTPPTEAFPDAILAYALSGTVTGSTDSPVARAIRAQREDTGAYVGGVISNATTGAYTISTPYSGEHTVVAYPVTGDGLPALVHHGVIPV